MRCSPSSSSCRAGILSGDRGQRVAQCRAGRDPELGKELVAKGCAFDDRVAGAHTGGNLRDRCGIRDREHCHAWAAQTRLPTLTCLSVLRFLICWGIVIEADAQPRAARLPPSVVALINAATRLAVVVHQRDIPMSPVRSPRLSADRQPSARRTENSRAPTRSVMVATGWRLRGGSSWRAPTIVISH